MRTWWVLALALLALGMPVAALESKTVRLYPEPSGDGFVLAESPGARTVHQDGVIATWENETPFTIRHFGPASLELECSEVRLVEKPLGSDGLHVISSVADSTVSSVTPDLAACTQASQVQLVPLSQAELDERYYGQDRWQRVHAGDLELRLDPTNYLEDLAFGANPWRVVTGPSTWYEVTGWVGLYQENQTYSESFEPADGTSTTNTFWHTDADDVTLDFTAEVQAGPFLFRLSDGDEVLYEFEVASGKYGKVGVSQVLDAGEDTEWQIEIEYAEGEGEGEFEAVLRPVFEGWPWPELPVVPPTTAPNATETPEEGGPGQLFGPRPAGEGNGSPAMAGLPLLLLVVTALRRKPD